jgi:hypothetical protein
VAEAFADLATRDAGWRHAIGRPDGPGWIAGEALRDARNGPLHDLLLRIGAGLRTGDRRTIAASFAVRFGWASGVAIGPYLRHRIVPDAGLEHLAFRFSPAGAFEQAALAVPRGAVIEGDPRASHPSITTAPDAASLRRVLRATLVGQSEPIVAALSAWSGFARRGTWGLLTSAWVSQFTAHTGSPRDHRTLLPEIDALFAGSDLVATMRPALQAVTCGGVTHLCQRRASCCREYLLPQGTLCASCPLVSEEERLSRNRDWMRQQLGPWA